MGLVGHRGSGDAYVSVAVRKLGQLYKFSGARHNVPHLSN